MMLEAMRLRRQVVCTYQGFRRELCPIVLGYGNGVERALTFQFAGQSSRPLAPGGEWRCLVLSGVSDITLREGPWYSGGNHNTTQSCVTEVHYDVNPESPLHPDRRVQSFRRR